MGKLHANYKKYTRKIMTILTSTTNKYTETMRDGKVHMTNATSVNTATKMTLRSLDARVCCCCLELERSCSLGRCEKWIQTFVYRTVEIKNKEIKKFAVKTLRLSIKAHFKIYNTYNMFNDVYYNMGHKSPM